MSETITGIIHMGDSSSGTTRMNQYITPHIEEQTELIDRDFWELRERLLATELNWVRRKLGKEPKTCPNCGEQLK